MRLTIGAFAVFAFSILTSVVCAPVSNATFSGDNGKIVYTKYNPYDYNTPYQTAGSKDGNLYISSSDGSGEQILKTDYSSYLRFSPDGQKILWASYNGSKWEASGPSLYSSNLDGSNVQLINSTQSFTLYWPQWSPSGQLTYYMQDSCCVMRTRADMSTDVLRTQYAYGVVSPDGDNYVAGVQGSPPPAFGVFPNFVTNRSPASEPTRTINGNFSYGISPTPVWSPNSKEIAIWEYNSFRNYTVFTVDVQTLARTHQYTYLGEPEAIVWSPDSTTLLVSGNVSTQPLYASPPEHTVTKIDIATGTQSRVNIAWAGNLVDWQALNHTPSGDPRLADAAGSNDLFRFYSPVTKHHLFTASFSEANHIISTMAGVWNYEGVNFRVKATSGCENGDNLYRFYSQALKTHMYTMDENEKATLIGYNRPDIWAYEGIAYCADKNKINANQKPVYRLYSPLLKTHLYTMDQNERDTIVRTFSSDVWLYEGISYYAYP